MAEYIRREDVIEWFMPYAHAEESIDADVVIADIKGMKAADVATVRHGRWLPQVVLGQKAWDCSECKTLGSPHWKWCPVCGAKMDGGFDNG